MKKKYYLFKMNTRKLNIISSIIGILLFIIFMVVYLQKLTIGELADEIYNAMPLIVILMFPYFILHEIFHSIAYVLHGAKFKNITYGAYLEKGILCCLCKQNISKKNILISLLYPFFFLGIVTIIIGYIINSYTLVILSILNISGCAGDFIMFYNLIKIKDYEFSEYDDPIAFGLYSAEDLSKRKLYGLDFVETKTKLLKEDLKKIRISQKSTISMIAFTIYGFLLLLINFILD